MPDVTVDSIDYVDETCYLVRHADSTEAAFAAARAYVVREDMEDLTGSLTEVVREGWFRKNPCHPNSCYDGGGHGFHLGDAKAAGRGNFWAVLVR